MGAYEDFIRGKDMIAASTGIAGAEVDAPWLFPFQRDLVRWSLRRGRAAIFADTGLGKTRAQLAWADAVATHTGGRVLILAPLAVATTGTVPEGERIGIKATYARKQPNAERITVANYEMLEHFDPSEFEGVALDESSVLKDFTSSTRTALIDAFAATPFRTAYTATPSPNDFTELGNHAEFLGVMRRVEMLAMFFTHDGGSTQDWTIKAHGREAFWRWVCSWAALVKRPSDLGYDDTGYILPPLDMHQITVAATADQARSQGKLFAEAAHGLNEQRAARRSTLTDRVALAAAEVAKEPDEPWVVWCELNDESEALAKAIPGAVEVRGSMTAEQKADALAKFARGEIRVLITKASVAGQGLNWQHCARIVYVGVSHSFEQWYQSIRRCWRFGQKRIVKCIVITSELEGEVLANLRRKEADAAKLAEEMRRYTSAIVSENVRGAEREQTAYEPTVEMVVPAWLRTEAA